MQIYDAALGRPEQAGLVAALLSQVVTLSPQGNGKALRRHVLERCEKAFELTPPPGKTKSHGSVSLSSVSQTKK
jgi:hypothetical protein